VGAHSSHGKSALALNVAVHVALNERVEGERCGVGYFSLEMPRVDLMRRAAANLAGFSARRLRRQITEDQGRRFVGAMKALSVEHLRIVDRASQTIDAIRLASARYAAQLRRTGAPLRLVVIDYAQILQPGDRRRDQNREQEVAAIGRAAKVLAGDLGATVLLLSQLNAESIKEGRLPRSTDLRESKALTNDANAVVLVWNPKVLERQEQRELGNRLSPVNEDTLDTCVLVAGKVRDGQVGCLDVGYRPALTRFEDLR
jgi:replicative DNA helicase